MGPSDGGFACVKGSHQEDFAWPFSREDGAWRSPEYPSQTSAIEACAGDCIVFNEKLTHGTWPWRGQGERRSIFMKYAPVAYSNIARRYDLGGYVQPLCAEVTRMLAPPVQGALGSSRGAGGWVDPAPEEVKGARRAAAAAARL